MGFVKSRDYEFGMNDWCGNWLSMKGIIETKEELLTAIAAEKNVSVKMLKRVIPEKFIGKNDVLSMSITENKVIIKKENSIAEGVSEYIGQRDYRITKVGDRYIIVDDKDNEMFSYFTHQSKYHSQDNFSMYIYKLKGTDTPIYISVTDIDSNTEGSNGCSIHAFISESENGLDDNANMCTFVLCNGTEENVLRGLFGVEVNAAPMEFSPDMTLTSFIRRCVDRYGERLLFKFDEQDGAELTYSQLFRRAEQIAGKLRSAGLDKGFAAVICMETRLEWYIFFWAVQLAGGIVVNYSHKASQESLMLALRETRAQIMLISDQTDISCAGKSEDLKLIIECTENVRNGCVSWNDFINSQAAYDLSSEHIEQSSNDTCLIQYTSGSSGKPKGVMLSHRGMLYVSAECARNTGMSCADRLISISPLNHSLGLINCMLGPMFRGASIYPLKEFTPGHAAKSIARNRITMTVTVPSMYIQIFEYAKKHKLDISSFRKGAVGGAALTPEEIKSLICDMGITDLVHGYGMTEFTSAMIVGMYNDPLEVKMNTIGRPVPGSEAKIIDLKTKEEINEPEREGELYFRGPGRMNGYLGDNVCCDPEEFCATGDIVKRRSDGNYVIVGRCSDIIIKGGENISPTQVQNTIRNCKGVRNAIVGSVPDKDLGEELIAFVIMENDINDIIHLREELRNKTEEIKIPRYIISVKDYIYNVNGKPDKKAMISAYKEGVL
ncbi:class I adenylate-forming enzyme family protein [Ruminococcus sp.]|uniref:class I adenylate-forming enzyme family protein n=1 Tax=Ruminococcus sp. TaxID=41978 RepID=UPI0025F5C607|nr:class I adenylate-forming enzyme family protein [Ruminococcus sp.]MCR4639223.1 acyl--CoA ligase [Ruminococcus sp.]